MRVNQEIVEFLEKFKGYQKCAPSIIADALKRKGKVCSTEECKEALHFVKYGDFTVDKKSTIQYMIEASSKEIELPINNTVKNKKQEIPEGFEIKSKWQNASGEWLMSLKPKEDKTEVVEDYYSVFQNIVKEEKNIDPIIIDLDTLPSGMTVQEHLDKIGYNYNIKGVKIIDTYDKKYNKKDLKVWTSDKHIGAIGSDDNEYSAEEFESRMDKLFNHILYLVKENGVFETITIADLGDAIDGMDGYTVSRTHKLPQNLNNKEMFEVYFRVHKKFFDKLFASGAAKNYQLWDITNANHSGDFEHVCKMALLAYIEGVYPEVKVEVLDKFLNVVEHEGIHYILTHGKDATNRKFGLPLYPDPKTESLIEAFLKRMDIPRKAQVRLVKGDLHMSASAPCKNIDRYKTVASMFGSSQWVVDNFELTEAAVDYEIMDLNTGIISESILKF